MLAPYIPTYRDFINLIKKKPELLKLSLTDYYTEIITLLKGLKQPVEISNEEEEYFEKLKKQFIRRTV